MKVYILTRQGQVASVWGTLKDAQAEMHLDVECFVERHGGRATRDSDGWGYYHHDSDSDWCILERTVN